MPNRAGLAPADRAYLEALRKVTREVGALLIFDEVITFRVGYRGAQGLWNIEPDLTSLGKIIGGGFPVGAVCGGKEFMAVFDPRPGKPALPHGGTFSANPVTMRAGIAAMECSMRRPSRGSMRWGRRFAPGSMRLSAATMFPAAPSASARCSRSFHG